MRRLMPRIVFRQTNRVATVMIQKKSWRIIDFAGGARAAGLGISAPPLLFYEQTRIARARIDPIADRAKALGP